MQLFWLAGSLLAAVGLVWLLVGWQPARSSLSARLLVAWARLVFVCVVLVGSLGVASLLSSVGASSLPRLVSWVSAWSGVSGDRDGSLSPSPVATLAGRAFSQGELSVLTGPGGPSLSASAVDAVLARYRSPAAGTGTVLYALSQQYGIDNAVAMAFFWHESHFGLYGEARVTHSPGNLRCIAGAACVDQERGGYAAFPTWEAGYEAWFRLIAGPLYVGDGRTTVERIIPRYAPSADNNDVGAYIADVRRVVERLRAGRF